MIIFVYGDDGLRVKERVDEMRDKFLAKFDPSGMNVSNIVVRVEDDARPGAVFGAVQSVPFLAPKRLVIVRNLLVTVKKANMGVWVDGFSRTPESTIVLFAELAGREKVEKTALFGALKSFPDVHGYPVAALEPGALRSWLAARAEAIGANIAPALLERLIARCGTETWVLDAELRKIAAYAGHEPVTEAMLGILAPATYAEDVFGLMDVFGRGDTAAALRRLRQERDAGVEDFPLFGMLARQIRLLLCMQLYLARNGRSDGAASALGMHPFVAQKIVHECRRHSLPRLREMHRHARELDMAMKRGLSPALAVDRLAVFLACA